MNESRTFDASNALSRLPHCDVCIPLGVDNDNKDEEEEEEVVEVEVEVIFEDAPCTGDLLLKRA